MTTRGDSEGFVSTPLKEKGARHKDSYYPMSDENVSEFNNTDVEFKRLEADFLGIARNRRRRDISRSEDQQIFQSLKSLHSTQPTWSSIKSKHSSICIKLRMMSSDTD